MAAVAGIAIAPNQVDRGLVPAQLSGWQDEAQQQGNLVRNYNGACGCPAQLQMVHDDLTVYRPPTNAMVPILLGCVAELVGGRSSFEPALKTSKAD